MLLILAKTIFSAALIVLSFPPWGYEHLIWISLVPWFFALERIPNIKRTLQWSFVFSFLVSAGSIGWIIFVQHEFMQFSWLVSFSTFFFLALFNHLQFVLGAPLYQALLKSRLSPFFVAFSFASGFVFLDLTVPHFFKETIGAALYQAPSWMQFAEWTGTRGLTFLIVAVNSLVHFSIRAAIKNERRSTAIFAGSALLLLGSTHGLGLSIRDRWDKKLKEESQIKRMSVIQGNISGLDKISAEKGALKAIDFVMDRYLLLSKQALDSGFKPEVLVWPETAYPTAFGLTHYAVDTQNRLWKFIEESKIPLMFGGYLAGDGKLFNGYFFLDPGKPLASYRKFTLVPFVEYVPGLENNAWIKTHFPAIESLSPGDAAHVYPIAGIQVGPLLCYEALYSSIGREVNKLGAQLLLNPMSVTWFNPFIVAELHLANIAFRAVENRLPLLVATSTGIGGLFLPTGELLGRGPTNQEAVLEYSVPILNSPSPTFFSKYGETWIYVLALISGTGFFFLKRRQKW